MVRGHVKITKDKYTAFGGSLPIYRLPPGGVHATNYKSTAFASLNVKSMDKDLKGNDNDILLSI